MHYKELSENIASVSFLKLKQQLAIRRLQRDIH